jgi:hypothetical protein
LEFADVVIVASGECGHIPLLAAYSQSNSLGITGSKKDATDADGSHSTKGSPD